MQFSCSFPDGSVKCGRQLRRMIVRRYALARDFREVGLALVGERREGFFGFRALEALPEDEALAVHLIGDPGRVAHQSLHRRERTDWLRSESLRNVLRFLTQRRGGHHAVRDAP
ncbi:hypothetical protein PT2222_190005 [Paraburkholderia tropica]